MGDDIDIKKMQKTYKSYGNSKWNDFKATWGLTQYSVFKKGGGGAKNPWRSRAKIVAANLLTAGLCNIYFRVKQDKSRSFKKSTSDGTPITLTHASPLERKLVSLKSYVGEKLNHPDKYTYVGFDKDLDFFLREIFGVARENRNIDEKFPKALISAKDDGLFVNKLEGLQKEAENMGIDFVL